MSKKTDFKILKRGLKYLLLTLPLLFLAPYLLTLSFLNKETNIFYMLLPLGLIATVAAIFMLFKSINTIMKSIF